MAGAGYQPTTMASTRGPGFVSGYSYLFCESSALLLAVFLLLKCSHSATLNPAAFGESRHTMNLKRCSHNTTPLSLHYLSVSLSQ